MSDEESRLADAPILEPPLLSDDDSLVQEPVSVDPDELGDISFSTAGMTTPEKSDIEFVKPSEKADELRQVYKGDLSLMINSSVQPPDHSQDSTEFGRVAYLRGAMPHSSEKKRPTMGDNFPIIGGEDSVPFCEKLPYTPTTPSSTTIHSSTANPSSQTSPSLSITHHLTTTPSVAIIPSIATTSSLAPKYFEATTCSPETTTTSVRIAPSVPANFSLEATPSVVITASLATTPSTLRSLSISSQVSTPSSATTPSFVPTPSLATTTFLTGTPSVANSSLATSPFVSNTPSLAGPPFIPSANDGNKVVAAKAPCNAEGDLAPNESHATILGDVTDDFTGRLSGGSKNASCEAKNGSVDRRVRFSSDVERQQQEFCSRMLPQFAGIPPPEGERHPGRETLSTSPGCGGGQKPTDAEYDSLTEALLAVKAEVEELSPLDAGEILYRTWSDWKSSVQPRLTKE